MIWPLIYDDSNFNPYSPGVSKSAQINLRLCIFQAQEDEWLEQDSEQVFVIEGAGLKRLVTDEKVKIIFKFFEKI